MTTEAFHLTQINRVKNFIQLHFNNALVLNDLAREAGISPFHFTRVFLGCTGETPYAYLRRIRIWKSCGLLREDKSITDIALQIGFETPSSFNKAFKELTTLNPTQFRNLGKAHQDEILYSLRIGNVFKETPMNLTENPEIISRPAMKYMYLERRGQCQEIAPPAWAEIYRLFGRNFPFDNIIEFIGFSMVNPEDKTGEEMIYRAGFAVKSIPSNLPPEMKAGEIPGGKYASFLLLGPYPNVWPAFEKIFKNIDQFGVKLREGGCLENYTNDPAVTPEDKLESHLLIPIE